jgi:DNA polymerase V
VITTEKAYIAIDLKSFYASVECVERGLDPLTTNLVVADNSRTEKTICLAVSPSLKSHGIPSRPRLFEVVTLVNAANAERRWRAPRRKLFGSSYDENMLSADPSIAIDYIVATPQMALYMDYSARIYSVYLKYFSPDDIHVYSIDEVFIDATRYLKTYKKTAYELAERIVSDVLSSTGITATVGIGTNLYLSKVAMDIVAKRMKPNADGARIAFLDEMSYRRVLWEHRPITDFWRVGHGYAKKLSSRGMHTMGDVALMSVHNEELLYRLFGINAELLIDHAWGYEPCEIEDIKSYRPQNQSISTGQVLSCPYEYEKARLITREMCDLLSLDLAEKHLVTKQLTLTVGYDVENLSDKRTNYNGEITFDYLGRMIPKHAHGTVNLPKYSSSTKEIVNAVDTLFLRIVSPALTVRRINITASGIVHENERLKKPLCEQLDFFTDTEEKDSRETKYEEAYLREKEEQMAIINIRKKFGKNAILKGMNFEEGATTIDRNMQIGGHRA